MITPKTVEYKAWIGMRDRCNNPNNKSYARYGGRGIRVCKRWDSFANFLKDMGPKPAGTTGKRPTYSVERRKNNGHYSPGNCYWGNTKQQARNTSRNCILTYNGKSLTIEDWAVETGIHKTTINSRVKAGWPVELILTAKPPYHRRKFSTSLIREHANHNHDRRIKFRGRTLHICAWAKVLGFNPDTLYQRFRSGWSVQKALTTPLKQIAWNKKVATA